MTKSDLLLAVAGKTPPRASSKALAQARVELWRFVSDVLHVLSNEGFAPACDDSELDSLVDSIAANIECEVY